MGCHTWFYIPYKADKNELIKLAQEELDDWVQNNYVSESTRQMYQYAIDNELVDPVCSLAADKIDGSQRVNGEWKVYIDPSKEGINKYNQENGTDYITWSEIPEDKRDGIEIYSNEPRITGYPEWIIRSYNELVEKMSTGYTDEDGKLHMFRYYEDRYPIFMAEIEKFFQRHPDGIITFG